MSKIGRNDLCPCGSGKKYKKCCEPSGIFAPPSPAVAFEEVSVLDDVRGTVRKILHDGLGTIRETADRLAHLIEARNFDEAEQIARQLEIDHPEDHGGTECLALISFARGLPRVAADHLRRAVAAMDARDKGNYCDGCRARMLDGIRDLDPSGFTPPLELPLV